MAFPPRPEIPLSAGALLVNGDRHKAIEQLKRGELKAIFTVDLFNEGVDLPTVDTILMLRPTESATIFLQQLGRGLRLADNKPCLTVLDFIGGQHADFRFDLRYRVLTGASRRALAREVEHDFPTLPAGCHIQLDPVAKQVVLGNLRGALRMRWADLAAELRRLGDVPLADFLADTGLDIEDLYRRKTGGGWSGLRRLAGLDVARPGPRDAVLGAAIGRLLHIDDPDRLGHLGRLVDGVPPPGRLGTMLDVALWGKSAPPEESIAQLRAHPDRGAELRQLARSYV